MSGLDVGNDTVRVIAHIQTPNSACVPIRNLDLQHTVVNVQLALRTCLDLHFCRITLRRARLGVVIAR